MICGEIERRTEKWEEASARFIALRPVIAAGEPKYEAIISQQLALVVRHDSRPHIVGSRPDAPPAQVINPATPRIALRSEPAPEPPPKPKPAPASKVLDLNKPFIAGGPDEEPVAVRPLVIRMPDVASANTLPKSDPNDPAFADTPPTIEVQPISDGLPDAEPLPEPVPVDNTKLKPVKKPKAPPVDDKKKSET